MNREKLMDYLSPFVKGEVPKDKRWDKAAQRVASQIPNGKMNEAIDLLQTMFHNPFVTPALLQNGPFLALMEFIQACY